MQENEYAQAAKEAFMAYIDAQSNLSIVKAEQTAQIDADIAQLRANVSAYDTAIDEIKQEEGQEGQEIEEADEPESVVLQPEEEECVGDPIGFEFKDENGNPVDLKLIKNDGDFDSVSDFLGSSTAGISELTDLANEDGIVDAEALKKGKIKFATVVDGELKTYTFEDLQKTYGISDIQIDVSKLDPNYKEEQEFGVTVNFAEQEAQEVTGYSDFKTAEEIKAMEGYGELIGDYDDTYRKNDVLINLPEQFRGSEYAQYIHVDENGDYYINIDVTDSQDEFYEMSKTLDDIIISLYSVDPEDDETIAILKAAIKVVNSPEQRSRENSNAEGSIFISGGQGKISSSGTKDGAKLLLVDKDAALELIPVGSEWYDLSEGNRAYRSWAKEAAAETDLIQELTANQGFTRDSEGRKVLDEGGEEFSNLLQSLTSDVVDEDGTVISTPEKVWANADFSQYSPETVLKLAQAFENNVEADGRTFLEAAKYYCGNGQAEDELIAVTDAIMSKAGNEQAALDMITKEIESALDNGDVDSITRLLNAAKENQSDMQIVLQQFEINNGVSLSSTLEELELNEEDLADYNKIITECENTVSNDMLDIINKLGSSVDGARTTLSGVAEKAWEELDVSNMTPSELLKLQQGYDSIYGEGSFLERAEQLYQGSTFDRIMNAVDTIKVDTNTKEDTTVTIVERSESEDIISRTEETIGSFIDGLSYASGVNNLEKLSDEDIAAVAYVYDSMNGEGAFKSFMENEQTKYEPSKLYEIQQKLEEAEFEATKEPDAASITLAEEEVNEVLSELTNDQAWESVDFTKYSDETIIALALGYQKGDSNFYTQALRYLDSSKVTNTESLKSITKAMLENDTTKEMLLSNLGSEDSYFASITLSSMLSSVAEGEDRYDAHKVRTLLEDFAVEQGYDVEEAASYIQEYGDALGLSLDSKITDIMSANPISDELRIQFEGLSNADMDIAIEMWNNFRSTPISEEDLAEYINSYEFIYGDGAFLSKAKEMSDIIAEAEHVDTYIDNVVDSLYLNMGNPNANNPELQIDISGLDANTAEEAATALYHNPELWTEELFKQLSEDGIALAAIANAYPDGIQAFTDELQTIDGYQATMYSEIKTSVYNAQIIAEQKEAEEAAKLIEITEDEATSAVTELINNGYDYWQNFDFSKYSEDSIVLIAQKYQSQMSESDHNFFEDALYYLEAEDIQSVTSALLSNSNDTSIKAILVDSISGDYADIAIQSIIDNVNIDKFLADDAKAVFESFEAINNLTIEKLVSTSNITMDDIDYIMNAPQITSETEALFKALAGDDKDLQRETWMSFLDNNITDEELLDFVNTFEYIYGESSFLETARVVSNSIYAENGETPMFDSIINNIYDNQEIADVNMEINFNIENGTTYATAQDLANALGKDSSLWSKIAFDDMEPQVLASVAKAYGVENFTTDFIRNNGVETTLYSILKVQVEKAYGNETNPYTMYHLELLSDNETIINYTKDDELLQNSYDEAINKTPLLIRDALMDENVPVSDKIYILGMMQEKNPDAVSKLLFNDFLDEESNLISGIIYEADIPDIVALSEIFNKADSSLNDYLERKIQSNTQTTVDLSNRLIDLYTNASQDEKNKLNTSFSIPDLLLYKLDNENKNAAIENLFVQLIGNLPDSIYYYADTDEEIYKLEILAREGYISTNPKDTIYKILTGVLGENLTANEAAYLLKVAGIDYNIAAENLAAGFSQIDGAWFSRTQDDLLPVFLKIFSSLNS